MKAKKVPKHGEDYVIGTCILDDGSRSVGIVFRDPDQRSLYKVDMTVDNTHRKYSTVRIQFKEVGVLFRLRRRLDKVGRRFGKWFKKQKHTKGAVEHKIKIPVNVCKKVAKAHSILKSSSKSADEVGCQLFINETWATLNPFDCSRHNDTEATVGSSSDGVDRSAPSLCLNPLSLEVIEELVGLGRSCSSNGQSSAKSFVY